MHPTALNSPNISSRCRFRFLVLSSLLATLSCSDETATEPEASFKSGVAAREVTIDISSFGLAPSPGIGKIFQLDFYRREGILFQQQPCVAGVCEPLRVGITQGDAAITVGHPPFVGIPLTATFTRPISSLTLNLAPQLQGTMTYVLSAFSASGELLGTTSRTVTQDFGDPANTGFGYFSITLTDLPKPAKSFSILGVFVRSTFELNTFIPFALSTISYTHWGGNANGGL
jgi:hypothetical protein